MSVLKSAVLYFIVGIISVVLLANIVCILLMLPGLGLTIVS